MTGFARAVRSWNRDRFNLPLNSRTKQERLDNLYDSLETKKLTVADLAPRIKKLKEEIGRLDLNSKRLIPEVPELTLTEQEVRAAGRSLRVVLERGTTAQQKQFLRSFVCKIEYQHPRVTIYYRFPLRPDSDDGGYLVQLIYTGKAQKVLCIDKPGAAGRTRTYTPVRHQERQASPLFQTCFCLCLFRRA